MLNRMIEPRGKREGGIMTSAFSAGSLKAIQYVEDDLETQRSLTSDERARMLRAVCRAAARLECSRLANGMPPSQSVPLPESTWVFLRKCQSDDTN